MSDSPQQEVKPQYEYQYQVDQQASVNAFIEIDIDGEIVKFQITARYGSTVEKIQKTVQATIEAYQAIRQFHPKPTYTVAAAPQSKEPVYVPVDGGGNEQPQVKVATAGRLSVEVKDNKFYYKVMDAVFAPGEKGTKYGINVYQEVIDAAGLKIELGQPAPNISGWRVDYLLNDKGFPGKVTRLLPPK